MMEINLERLLLTDEFGNKVIPFTVTALKLRKS